VESPTLATPIPPINTVELPDVILEFPCGALPCGAIVLPIRATDLPSILTVLDPVNTAPPPAVEEPTNAIRGMLIPYANNLNP
jgi:hypothetical protein